MNRGLVPICSCNQARYSHTLTYPDLTVWNACEECLIDLRHLCSSSDLTFSDGVLLAIAGSQNQLLIINTHLLEDFPEMILYAIDAYSSNRQIHLPRLQI